MQKIRGNSVFGGIAVGKICVYKKEQQQIKRRKTEDTDTELKRFQKAKEEALRQLHDLYEKAKKEVGEADAAIFEVHQMMLEDDDYIDAVKEIILTQKVNAEYAVGMTSDQFEEQFASMEDAYMKERAADVRDVSERILSILSGTRQDMTQNTDPMILIAEDLAPSETVQLEKDKVLAFVTVHGSANSHTAILARTMGIPALIGTPIGLDEAVDGTLAVVDGTEGVLYIDPDEETLKRYEQRQREEGEKRRLLQQLRGKETITLDGRKMRLYANIGDTKDLALALENDAEGIGLFRSEFLYLERETYPTEEEQFEVYKKVAKTMGEKRVIIRTLDVGADKQADYLGLEKEENPAMGCRAIRICLMRPEIFKTQLRALLRASAYGRIAVMYPMITSVEEVRRIKEIMEEVKAELREQKTAFGEPEQGIMIETPAAVMISDLLAREVDFFSIGTNDLTQYALAVDRQNPQLEKFYNPYHEAVLRMIEMTVKNSHKAGIWTGICGELGADLSMTRTFLELGVDELSVSPASILPVRKTIREMRIDTL